MKLSFEALARHLSQATPLSPVYLVSGDEPLLVEEARAAIRKAALAQGYLIQQRLEAQGRAFDWHSIHVEAHTLSLFSEKTLIELHLPTAKPGSQGSRQLVHAIKNLSEDKILLMITGKFDRTTHQTAWCKAIDKAGVIIRIGPITPYQFPAWLKTRLQKAGLCLEAQALEDLVYYTEGNLLAAAQTIERLQLQYGQGAQPLDREALQSALADSARFDVYQLVETAIAGHLTKTLRILSSLQAEAVPPTLILWAISRELRRLSQIAHGLQQGQSLPTLFESQAVWSKHQPILEMALRRRSQAWYWERLINYAQTIDCLIKGVSRGDYWVAFERLLVRIAWNPSGDSSR